MATLAFTTQPNGSVSGSVLTQPPVVTLFGGSPTASVTLTVLSGNGTILTGATVAGIAGVATFSNLNINGFGAHTLRATATGYDPGTSNVFAVVGALGVVNTLSSGNVTYDGLAAFGSNVYVVNTGGGQTTPKFRRSTDQGATWPSSQEQTLNGSGTTTLDRPLAADGTSVGVLTINQNQNVPSWHGPAGVNVGDLSVRRSLNSGAPGSWTTPAQVIGGPGAKGKANRLGFGIKGAFWHVAWSNNRQTGVPSPPGTWDIEYARSTNDGVNWSTPITLAAGGVDPAGVGAGRPSVAVDGAHVHVAWMDARDGRGICPKEPGGNDNLPQCTEVYYRHSGDNGANWDAIKRVTISGFWVDGTTVKYAGRPYIAARNDVILIVFDQRNSALGNDIAVTRSINNGVDWTTPTLLTNVAGESTHASLAWGTLNNEVAVIFGDDLATATKHNYERFSVDAGLTWSPVRQFDAAGSQVGLIDCSTDFCHGTYSNGGGTSSGTLLHRRHPISSSSPPPSNTKIIGVSPSLLAYGNRAVGSTSILTFSITNSGNTNLAISGITMPVGFTVSQAFPFSITPGLSIDIGVTFSPIFASTYGGTVTVTSDATSPGGNTLQVTGTGTVTPPPPPPPPGNTITAASCSSDHITAAIASAVTGDTVAVPAGTCTWTGQVTIPSSKNITLQGAGIGQTVCTAGSNSMLSMGTSLSRVTGFTFKLGAFNTVISANGRGYRIDHCRFEATSFKQAIETSGAVSSVPLNPTGVIDHNEFLNCRILVRGAFPQSAFAGSSAVWAAPLGLGTSDFIFIEDNTFLFTVFGNCIDSNDSSRYVFRHNDVQDCWVEAHSITGVRRGARAWEIYENTIRQVNEAVFWPIFLRNGTGVCFNNTISGNFGAGNIGIDNRRSNPADGQLGTQAYGAYGGNVIDGNTKLTSATSTTEGEGTHTGANGSATLTDTAQNWSANKFALVQGSQTRWMSVYNVTDGSKGQISGNTPTTVTATLSGGTDNDWDTGDVYLISDGYPARDQIGRSTDAFLWTVAEPNPPQASDPAYFWGNTRGGVYYVVQVENGTNRHIKPGRDYFDSASTAKPGYTPYVYPHPLQGVAIGKIISVSGDLAFGNVIVGTTTTRTIAITNTGDTTLNVSSITYPAGFTGAFNGTIAGGATQNVIVTFAPVAVITYSGIVTVNSDATSGSNTINASGNGIPVPTPGGQFILFRK